jgi:hypothetical protein
MTPSLGRWCLVAAALAKTAYNDIKQAFGEKLGRKRQ